MPDTHDFIIVGGGIIGMLSALELAKHGSVALIERGHTGREASWAGGGILSPLYPWRYADAINELARWGQQRYRALAATLHQTSGIDPEYLDSGMLILDPGDEREVRRWARRFGATIETLDRAALRACEPALNPAFDSALWLPAIGQMRNPRLTRALRGTIEAAGVRIIEDTPVLGLSGDDQRVNGVRTAGGTLGAAAVIVATGSWSSQLMPPLPEPLPVIPIKGQMVLTRAVPGLVRRITLNQGRYLIPRADGRVVTGSTLEQVGYDKHTTDQARDELRATACGLVPALADYPVEHHWSGLRPSSPGGIPFIGPYRGRGGLYLNTGHFRNGVVIGYASARLLADLVLQREPTLDPAPYSVDAPRPAGQLL